MHKITAIGLDLAKNVFYVVCCANHGKVVRKRMLERREVTKFFTHLAPCLASMDACASTHHRTRQLVGALGKIDSAAVCEALCTEQ